MQVLVTGASGKIGKSLTTSLLALGHRVRALDIERGGDEPSLEWICADSTDVSALRAAMVGCDAVIHLAALAQPWLGTEEEVFRVNDYGTFCVYRAAAESGVGRVVADSRRDRNRRHVPVERSRHSRSRPRLCPRARSGRRRRRRRQRV